MDLKQLLEELINKRPKPSEEEDEGDHANAKVIKIEGEFDSDTPLGEIIKQVEKQAYAEHLKTCKGCQKREAAEAKLREKMKDSNTEVVEPEDGRKVAGFVVQVHRDEDRAFIIPSSFREDAHTCVSDVENFKQDEDGLKSIMERIPGVPNFKVIPLYLD